MIMPASVQIGAGIQTRSPVIRGVDQVFWPQQSVPHPVV